MKDSKTLNIMTDSDTLRNGDCLNELKKVKLNSIDLIYLDPPFFTQKKQIQKTRDNLKEYSFSDSWESVKSYKDFITERLIECKKVLKSTGSLFLHCDRSASHYLRIALDEVFGIENFQSEIVWAYKRWSNAKRGLLNSHQIIYFYSKTRDFKFNFIYDNYSPTTNIDQIFQKRARDENGKTKYKLTASGDRELIEEKRGVPLSDVWEIPYLNPKAKERAGYPTQKPILLLEKIIQLVTKEGDVVLDPFCGSGTTLVAAKLLNRKYLGIDISKDALELTNQRLENPIKTHSNLLKNGKQSYSNQSVDILELLEKIGAVPVQRNKGIDGFLKINNSVRPIPIKIQRQDETFEKAQQLLCLATNKNKFNQKILIKTNDSVDNVLFNFVETAIPPDITVISNLNEFIRNKEKLFDNTFDLPNKVSLNAS